MKIKALTVNKGIRWPSDIIDEVKEAADENNRSFSQEVIFRCRRYGDLKQENIKIQEEKSAIRGSLDATLSRLLASEKKVAELQDNEAEE